MKFQNYITRLATFLICFHLTACAVGPKEPGAIDELGNNQQGQLLVSGDVNHYMSSMHFRMMTFTIENDTDDWIRLHDVRIEIPDKQSADHMKIVSGNELVQWHNSTIAMNEINDLNTKVLLSGLAGLGLAAMAGGSGRSQDLGAAVAIGSALSLTISEFAQQTAKVSGAKIFPESHLLYGDILIPPKLFVKKWLVFQARDKKLFYTFNTVLLHCTNQDKKAYRFKVKVY